jgi:autoinducer 2-degrading protein
MYVITVQLKVKADRIDEFLALTLDNATKARREPGCLRFDVLRAEKDPDRFFFYEVYKTPADHKAHQETAHYLRWKEGAGDLMAEPRMGQRFINVSPLDAEWR